eukprot:1489519-Lingulodinium_polyedra.AAC.1
MTPGHRPHAAGGGPQTGGRKSGRLQFGRPQSWQRGAPARCRQNPGHKPMIFPTSGEPFCILVVWGIV